MPKKIYGFLIFLSIFTLAVPQALAALSAQVNYDGEQISVHADGVSLGQLLPLVEKQTGVHFFLNSLTAETIVYANFKNSALSDGIKRILSKCCNHAMLYDRLGSISSVFVFARQSDLNKGSTNHRALYDPQDDTLMASNESKESEALSDPTPDQGSEGMRPPPWVNEGPLSPQGLPTDSGNELTPSPVDSAAEDNNSPQNENQPQSPTMDSNAEDVSPSEPQE